MEIDKEIDHLRKLASQLLDKWALDSITNRVIELEAERTASSPEAVRTASVGDASFEVDPSRPK